MEKGPLHDFLKSYSCGILLSKEGGLYGSKYREAAKKYMDNPPEGMTSEGIHHMSEDELLDMDYFLNEDDPFDDGFGEEGFLYLLIQPPSYCHVQAHVFQRYV